MKGFRKEDYEINKWFILSFLVGFIPLEFCWCAAMILMTSLKWVLVKSIAIAIGTIFTAAFMYILIVTSNKQDRERIEREIEEEIKRKSMPCSHMDAIKCNICGNYHCDDCGKDFEGYGNG